jgi:hypothetical protein
MTSSLLYFFHTHREASVLTNELPEESGQFRFLGDTCFVNLKGSVGLILAKSSDEDFYTVRFALFYTTTTFHSF